MIGPSISTQENATEGQPGFCPRDRDPENPAEIAVPTPSKVKATKIAPLCYLADPGEARGCSIKSLVIHSLIQ